MLRIFGLLVLVGLLGAGCSTKPLPDDGAPPAPAEAPEPGREGPADPRNVVSGVGTITYLDFEGGFYGLVADDGARYDPLNLDDAYRQDSLRVRFRVRLQTGVMTIRMWGKPVEVLEIARLDER